MFRKKRPVPPAVASELKELEAIASAELADGTWLGASRDAISVVTEDGVKTTSPWTDLESAGWDGDTNTLTLRWIDGTPPTEYVTADSRVLPLAQAVRERVNASLVHVEMMGTEAGGDVRALIRKDGTGRLFSQVIARGALTPAEEWEVLELEQKAKEAVGLSE